MKDWYNIIYAPKETELLVYRKDAGIMLGKLTSLSEVLHEKELEKGEYTEEELFENHWFISDATGAWMVEVDGSEAPTHWMSLPCEPLCL